MEMGSLQVRLGRADGEMLTLPGRRSEGPLQSVLGSLRRSLAVLLILVVLRCRWSVSEV